jgi:hypothetical protein
VAVTPGRSLGNHAKFAVVPVSPVDLSVPDLGDASSVWPVIIRNTFWSSARGRFTGPGSCSYASDQQHG